MSGRLTEGFREIIELRWSDFVELEQSVDATNFDAVVSSVARACMKGNLRAIQTALDRIDGKIATEIALEFPKFYTLYPRATKTVDDPAIIELLDTPKGNKELFRQEYLTTETQEMLSGGAADMDELEVETEELPTGSLRLVLEKMLNSPKTIVNSIIESAASVDKGDLSKGNPYVKSVVVAGLMKLVHDGRISAVFEVFDQIDGKVAETLKVLGDDVYMTRFDEIAPAGAVKNENGVYQIVAQNVTNVWTARLEQGKGKR